MSNEKIDLRESLKIWIDNINLGLSFYKDSLSHNDVLSNHINKCIEYMSIFESKLNDAVDCSSKKAFHYLLEIIDIFECVKQKIVLEQFDNFLEKLLVESLEILNKWLEIKRKPLISINKKVLPKYVTSEYDDMLAAYKTIKSIEYFYKELNIKKDSLDKAIKIDAQIINIINYFNTYLLLMIKCKDNYSLINMVSKKVSLSSMNDVINGLIGDSEEMKNIIVQINESINILEEYYNKIQYKI